MILEILREEYDKEKQTTQSLDNKAGIFLSALVVIETVWIQIVPIKDIIMLFEQYEYSKLIALGISLIVLFLLFSLNIILLVKCLMLRNFSAVNMDSIITESRKNVNYKKYMDAVVDHYNVILHDNIPLNQKKSEYLKKSIKVFGIYSVLSIVILVIVIAFV